MLYAVLTLIITVAVFFPSMWVRYAMSRHAKTIDDMPGTGGELANHLIDKYQLTDVIVEETGERGDHFDPSAKAVRLSPSNFQGKSLTAIAVAAHEVGHAIQFHRNERVSQLRARYIPTAMLLKRAGIMLIGLAPIVGFLIKAPAAIFAFVGLSLALQLLGALAYLIVLPEEWDASFNKALPLLVEGGYIHEHHVQPVRQVLKAAALTYFAAALADLLNIGRWLVILRR